MYKRGDLSLRAKLRGILKRWVGDKIKNMLTTKTIKKGHTILLIEDDVFLNDLLMSQLNKKGFNVLSATDGISGLKLIESSSPDLVLLDLLLPTMDGFELLAHMNQAGLIKRVPVIVISNLAGKENVERAKSLGAKEYLVKAQSTITQIIERITEVLGNGE